VNAFGLDPIQVNGGPVRVTAVTLQGISGSLRLARVAIVPGARVGDEPWRALASDLGSLWQDRRIPPTMLPVENSVAGPDRNEWQVVVGLVSGSHGGRATSVAVHYDIGGTAHVLEGRDGVGEYPNRAGCDQVKPNTAAP
jgi:hypothetical protein